MGNGVADFKLLDFCRDRTRAITNQARQKLVTHVACVMMWPPISSPLQMMELKLSRLLGFNLNPLAQCNTFERTALKGWWFSKQLAPRSDTITLLQEPKNTALSPTAGALGC